MGLALINIKSAFCSFQQEESDIEKGQAHRISAAIDGMCSAPWETNS